MATTISGSPRITSTTPTQGTDEVAPQVEAPVVDPGFGKASSFQKFTGKANDAKELLKTGTSLSDNVEKLAGDLFNPNTSLAAKSESLLADASALVGVAKDTRQLVEHGVKLTRGDGGVKSLTAKTQKTDKVLGMAGNAATLLDGNASLLDRVSSGVELAKTAVSGTGLAAKLEHGLEATSRFVGGAAGVVGVYTNGKAAVEDFKKLAHGDVKAGIDGVKDTVATANSALTAVEGAAKGAKLLEVGGKVAEKTLGLLAKAGPLTKALPMIGAAIGTAKAGYDFYKHPSVMNGAKVVANALGFIPGVGSVASIVATTALDHPDLCVKGAKAVANAASKAWSWVSGG
jgi:hypothetical protein